MKRFLVCMVLFACVVPMAQARRRAPLMISPAECREHKLPALGLVMPWNTGVATLRKFPSEGVYVGNEPTPPGGAYLFEVVAGKGELLEFLKGQYPRASFTVAPDWQGKYPACTFVEGQGHARTAYAAVQLPAGAVMIHGYGPWTAKTPDFNKLSEAFRQVRVEP